MPVNQISDGQVQATSAAPAVPVTQISDGQPQAASAAALTQISDGQVQAPSAVAVSQISDGQIQASASKSSNSTLPVVSSLPAASSSGLKITSPLAAVLLGLLSSFILM